MNPAALSEEKIVEIGRECRRYFHAHPEISTQEAETSAKIFSLLEEWGLSPVRGTGHYGVAATLKGKSEGPLIALRADMDALSVREETGLPFASQNEGVMHACGHDVHMAILLETVLRLLQRRDDLFGSVRILFQPSEELSPTGGARLMMKDGFLDGVSGVFGLHVWPSYPVGRIGIKGGPLMAASDRFRVTIKGRTAHAGHPHEGVDAILAAADFLQEVSHIVSRRVSPLDTATINVGTISGGSRYNVVPGSCILEGTIRTLNETTRDHIPQWLEGILKGLEQSAGITYEFNYFRGYPVLMNWPKPAELVRQTAQETLGEEAVMAHVEPDLTAEDFGFYLQKVPGAFLWLGCSTPGTPAAGLHNARCCPDEKALEVGSRLMAGVAIKALAALSADHDFFQKDGSLS
ncbi:MULTISPECIES: M20 family metallopeptidase [Acidaminococcus]|uniref:M20 metallopeptidase family protein n=1 Tax=Acidaminococcus TaxID=904 RepID=UPI0003ADD6D5|nr:MULTISPECIES: amidohydrolase [Acidaminococcus]ERL19712.1 amidohydrolase [Acidaminococcus sp. BV3L6]RJU38662.1 amidohydrolase [Acidaminococcus sp. AM33-14BH]